MQSRDALEKMGYTDVIALQETFDELAATGILYVMLLRDKFYNR